MIPAGGMFQSSCTFSGSAAGATGAFGIGAAGGSGNANGGGGGGGGYFGGGGGASGRTASGCSSPPTGIAGGGGAGSSFISSLMVNGAFVASPTTIFSPAITIQPLIQVLAPTNGASYAQGQVVNASYDCYYAQAAASSCAGTVPSGSPIDTATTGRHTFTVGNAWATGLSAVATTVTYTVGGPAVKPTGTAAISGARSKRPTVVLTVRGSGMTKLVILPPTGVTLVAGRLSRGAAVSQPATAQLVGGALALALKAPAQSLTLTLSGGAVKLSKRLVSESRAKKVTVVTFTVDVTENGGTLRVGIPAGI